MTSSILVTRHYPVPSRTGALLYSKQLITLFSQCFDSVDVLCRGPQFQAREDSENPICPFNERGNVKFHITSDEERPVARPASLMFPVACLKNYTKENYKSFLRVLRKDKPDCVIVDHIGSAWVLGVIRKENYADVKVIYCSHNHEYEVRRLIARSEGCNLLKRFLHLLESYRVNSVERRLVSTARFVTTISNADANSLCLAAKGKKYQVIRPLYQGYVEKETPDFTLRPRRVVVLGSYMWSAKRLNLERLLVCAQKHLVTKGIEVFVVGEMKNGFLNKLKSRYPEMTFTGGVPSVTPYLKDARVGIVAEDAGGGFKLKVLDYIFHRVPVAATRGSVVDVPLRPYQTCILADSVEELCRRVADAIDDEEELLRIQDNMFNESKKFLRLDDVLNALRQNIDTVLSGAV